MLVVFIVRIWCSFIRDFRICEDTLFHQLQMINLMLAYFQSSISVRGINFLYILVHALSVNSVAAMLNIYMRRFKSVFMFITLLYFLSVAVSTIHSLIFLLIVLLWYFSVIYFDLCWYILACVFANLQKWMPTDWNWKTLKSEARVVQSQLGRGHSAALARKF